jgi:hypothetical protein
MEQELERDQGKARVQGTSLIDRPDAKHDHKVFRPNRPFKGMTGREYMDYCESAAQGALKD